MSSPFPVTSATSTERATGLAERVVVANVPPAAVVIPNGTPPSGLGPFAIHSVSGRPSPSTSMVCLVTAPDGRLPFDDVHPPAAPDDAAPLVPAAEDDEESEDDDVPAAEPPPDDPQPASTGRAV